MSRRLPPLNSLRVFEAVARHLSITKAADAMQHTWQESGPRSEQGQIRNIEGDL